jgi:thiol-disulfide isomerase/thioredoxin
MPGLVTALVALALATAGGLWWRGRDGRIRAVPQAETPGGAELARLGVTPGVPVTLLQFSSAFCAPCRATRRVCAEVAERFEGVAHVEVDAESHLDAVRELDIWRTPTVLVVDAAGRVVHRATGTPAKAHVIAAIAALLPAGAAR